MSSPTPTARHRARPPRRALLALGGLILAIVFIVTAVSLASRGATATPAAPMQPLAELPTVDSLPVPQMTAVPRAIQVCELPTVLEAVSASDDEGVITAAGGGAPFRAAVIAGRAPCIDLSSPSDVWFVVNKQRPFPQADWAPSDLIAVDGVRSLDGSLLERKAANALSSLAEAVRTAGGGDVAVASGYRSYQTQTTNHAGQVAVEGQHAEMSSARAGFSEHQTGLTADLVSCTAGACGTLDAFGSTAQGQWIAENGWEYGWIVRYEAGQTAVTGYETEPWHLRYVGPDLARAYATGGFHSLEDFFGLPAAPDYAG